MTRLNLLNFRKISAEIDMYEEIFTADNTNEQLKAILKEWHAHTIKLSHKLNEDIQYAYFNDSSAVIEDYNKSQDYSKHARDCVFKEVSKLILMKTTGAAFSDKRTILLQKCVAIYKLLKQVNQAALSSNSYENFVICRKECLYQLDVVISAIRQSYALDPSSQSSSSPRNITLADKKSDIPKKFSFENGQQNTLFTQGNLKGATAPRTLVLSYEEKILLSYITDDLKTKNYLRAAKFLEILRYDICKNLNQHLNRVLLLEVMCSQQEGAEAFRNARKRTAQVLKYPHNFSVTSLS